MLLDLWRDEYESIAGRVTETRVNKYTQQIDETAFKELKDRLDEYGFPVHESFPDGKSMTGFLLLDSDLRVTLRVGSEGGIANLYITTELPDELVDKEALVRAIDDVAGDVFRTSHREVSYYRNNNEAGLEYIVRA